jgi:hypothetical protein
MATVGNLVVNLMGDSSHLQKTLSGAQSLLGGFKTKIAAAVGAVGIGALFKGGIEDAETAFREQAKLGAVLQATGGAAGVTRTEIANLAGELQTLTTISDDATMGAAAQLATFGNISGEMFKDTLRLAQDLSVVMGGDVTSATKVLGKALSDPERGMDTLRKQGIMLSAAQKDQITNFMKVNNLAGAQKVILDQLATSVGGAAQAVKTPLMELRSEFGDLWKDIGKIAKAFGFDELARTLRDIVKYIRMITAAPEIEFVSDKNIAKAKSAAEDQKRAFDAWKTQRDERKKAFTDRTASLVDGFNRVSADNIDNDIRKVNEYARLMNRPELRGNTRIQTAIVNKHTGIVDAIRSAQQQTEALQKNFTEIDKTIQSFASKGAPIQFLDQLRKALTTLEQMTKQREEYENLTKNAARYEDDLRSRASQLISDTRSPLERLKQELDGIRELRDLGMVSDQQADIAEQNAATGIFGQSGSTGAVGAAEMGSQAAFGAIQAAIRSGQNDEVNKQILAVNKRQLEEMEKQNDLRREQAQAPAGLPVGI